MIPRTQLTPTVPSPVPTCSLPTSDEISEEGFGYFRGVWFIGRVLLADAQSAIEEEGEMLEWLDQAAPDAKAFEVLATAIENQEPDDVPDALGCADAPAGLEHFVGDAQDFAPLGGLEIGVAGLCHALSVVGCLTAASCRSHATAQTWSDCPVVFFAAPTWRVELLAELISAENSGLDADRDMLKIYAPSVRDIHRLAGRVVAERDRFRTMPDRWRPQRERPLKPAGTQLRLISESGDRPTGLKAAGHTP